MDRQYYAVFDGHGGGDAATFAATHLHVVLSQQEDLVKDPGAAFKAAFTHVDDMFKVKAKREVSEQTSASHWVIEKTSFIDLGSSLNWCVCLLCFRSACEVAAQV